MRRRVSFRLRETRAGKTSVILLLFVSVIIMAGGEGGEAFSASSSSSTASGTTTSSNSNNAGDTGSSSSTIPQLLPSDPNDVATTKLPSIKLGETIRFEQFGTSFTRKTIWTSQTVSTLLVVFICISMETAVSWRDWLWMLFRRSPNHYIVNCITLLFWCLFLIVLDT